MTTLLEHTDREIPLVDLSTVALAALRTLNSPELRRALRHVVEQSVTPQVCDQNLDNGWYS